MKSYKHMIATFVGILLSIFIFALPAGAAGGHYVPGVEGVMAATVPPPGFHYRMYSVFLDSDTLTDAGGDKQDIGFDLKVFAQVHRFVLITNKKIFGAQYGMDFLVPIAATDFNINALDLHDAEIGLGDITFEPLILSWHGSRWDYALAWGVNFPTGEYDQNEPASPGHGYFSSIFTAGGTYYFDEQKSWSASLLSRTLNYGEQDDTKITPGWESLVEWGIGKQFPVSNGLLIRPGLCGYGYWQLGEDSGPGSTNAKGRNFAIGAEINLFWIPPHLIQANLRVLQDVETKDEAEATKVVFTLTKSF
jgi:hypothetical protein